MLEFENIHHTYGAEPVLQALTLTAHAGDITCLLGPSGCGKTTLLRLAAGLTPLQRGRMRLDGAVLAEPGADPPPERRPIGLLFQEGALFPHLTVQKNVGFALKGGPSAHARYVAALLEQVGLPDVAHRYPDTLSGGQQQRVALARALAPGPRVLLLDEPFASIDITLRRTLREEMRLLLKAAGVITILVTHDPDETLDMADRIAVMEHGRIIQADTPEALYDAPASASVAAMIGGGQGVPARREAAGLRTAYGLWPLSCLAGAEPTTIANASAANARATTPKPPLDMLLMARPEALQLTPDGPCQIADVRLGGERLRITLAAPNGERLVVSHPRHTPVVRGQHMRVTPKPGAIFAFPKP